MMNFKKNYRFIVYLFLLVAVVASTTPVAYAWDFSGSTISDYNHVNIETANGAGYYVGFRNAGGGLNALHITSSTSSPYGQVSTVSSDSGTFYLADTGGRGYFDKVVLMVAIKAPDSGEELSEDLKINIKASGYRWTSNGVKDQPPLASDITYVRNSIDRSFGLYSVTYGPQSWKPAGEAEHPIMYDQGRSDEFYIFFVDTGVGALGKNSEITGLTDNGMAKIEYSIENYNGETIVFNVYGYALNADAVQNGIAWTNKIEGTTTDKNSGTASSGYIVLLGSSASSDDEFSNSEAIDYGSEGGVSYSSSEVWSPSVGNLNITSEPVGANIYIDGVDSGETTNASFADLPAGDYTVRVDLQDYDPAESEVHIKAGYITTRNFNLTQASGRCTVLSDVRGARLYIDDEETLCYANWTFTDILAGNHTITIKTAEGRNFSKEIYVGRDNETTVFFETSPNDQSTAENITEVLDDSEAVYKNYTGNIEPEPEKDYPATPVSPGTDTGIMEQFFSFITGVISPEASVSPAASGFSGSEEKIPANNIPGAVPESVNITDDSGEFAEETADENVSLQQTQIGSVYVTSYPEGMSIYIDGVDTDYTTPHLIYGLKKGYHKIQVKQQSSFSDSKEVYVPAGEPTAVHFNLVDVDNQVVSISVSSKYIASFAVNGELPYSDVPSKVKAESFGSYLTFNDGENYYSMTLPFLSGGESFVLNKGKNVGSLSVGSDPDDADIYIDGMKTGYRTPCILDNIGDGYHRLKVIKEGYLPVEKEISFISEGNAVDDSYSFVLEEISTGNLIVTSDPQGCMIFLRGDYTGQVTPYTFEEIPIGTYDVGVMFNRTIFKDKEVTVQSSRKYGDTILNISLEVPDST